MKTVLSLILTSALVLSASLALAADATRLTFGTGGTSGVYFPLGEAIAQVIASKNDGKLAITIQSTGASGENMRLVHAGDVTMAIVQNDVADAAYNGNAPFREALNNVRAVARLYPEYLHVVASKDSGVTCLQDFKGKKVSVGARGSGNEVNCRQIFGAFGLDYKNVKPKFLPYGATADMFKDRQLDGFVFTSGTPNPSIQDITTAQEVVFVPLQGNMLEGIMKKYPYLVADTIPANTYTGQTEPVPTLSVQALLVVGEETADDIVYTLTKTLFENLPEVAKVHNKAAEISLAHATDGVTIPFHPGAEKYFREKGILQK